MPSSPQTLPTVQVFGYVYNPLTGAAVPVGTPVQITWKVALGSVAAPLVNVIPESQTVFTDANGYWTVNLVPPDKLSPANSTYHVTDTYNSYDIGNFTLAGMPVGGYQDLNIRVAPAPAVLPPGAQTVGALTVTGLLTAQAGLTVTGATNVQSITASGLITGSAGLTISAGGVAITGNSTVTGTLTSSGALTVQAGGAAITGNSTVTGTLTVSAGLTVQAGGAAITGNSTVTGTLTISSTLNVQGGVIFMQGAGTSVISGGTVGFAIQNNAANANNALWSDAGLMTLRNAIVVPPSAGAAAAATSYGTLPVKIAEVLLAATSTDVSFTSIPGGFRHLSKLWSARGDSAANFISLLEQVNGDTAAHYNAERVAASGNAAPSGSETLLGTSWTMGDVVAANGTAAYFSAGVIRYINYSGTVSDKVVQSQMGYSFNNLTGQQAIEWFHAAWSVTATAITQTDSKPSAGNFIIGSLWTLQGEP